MSSPNLVKLASGFEHYDDGYSSDESLNDSLDFDAIGFIGRQDELKVLNDVFDSLGGDSLVPVILIKGPPGTGKSTLASKFIDDINVRYDVLRTTKRKAPLVLTGAYDELNQNHPHTNPFSAIIEALSVFLTQIEENDTKTFKKIKKQVTKSIGEDESRILITCAPSLVKFFGVDVEPSDQYQEFSETVQRPNFLKYCFLAFFKAICAGNQPLIMFLENLQWADDASLDLISTLLSNESLSHLMFLGTCRDDNAKNRKSVKTSLGEISKARYLQLLDLEDLSVKETGKLISRVLHLTEDLVKDLTTTIFSVTMGNILLVKENLKDLDRNKSLYFCHMSFRWQWNLNEVQMCDTVANMVVAKLERIPKKVQEILIVAAHTKFTINTNVLLRLVESTGSTLDIDGLRKLLAVAIDEGLVLGNNESKEYRFAHHRIRRTAYELASEGIEKEKLKAQIGKCLWEIGTSPTGEDWMLFTASNHFNSVRNEQDHLFIAQMNLKVGMKAYALNAFEQTSAYLEKGMEALKQIDSHWNDHYDLSLRLYRETAAMHLCLGRFDIGAKVGESVLVNAKAADDTLPTYYALSSALGRQELNYDALRICRKALRVLGCYPKLKRPFLAKNIVKLKNYFHQHTDEEILGFPILQNERKFISLRFCLEAIFRAQLCGNFMDFGICNVIGLNIIAKYGLCCSESAQVISSYAIFLQILGDHKCSIRLGNLAKKIVEKFPSKAMEGKVLFSIGNYIIPWTDLSKSEAQITFQRGYASSMQSGNFERAIFNRTFSAKNAYFNGFPLEMVEEEIKKTINEFQFYGKSGLTLSEQHLQHIQYLRSNGEIDWETLELSEPEVKDKNETIDKKNKDKSEVFKNKCKYGFQMQLGVFFGNFSYAEQMEKKYVLATSKIHVDYSTRMEKWTFPFFIAIRLAHKTGKRFYISKARKIMKDMLTFTKKIGCSCNHLNLLMKAELMPFKTSIKIEKIKEAYDKAITESIEKGHVYLAALACEFAAELMTLKGNSPAAGYYLYNARNCYEKWGATAKVLHLNKTQSAILQKDTSASDPHLNQLLERQSCLFNSNFISEASTSLASANSLNFSMSAGPTDVLPGQILSSRGSFSRRSWLFNQKKQKSKTFKLRASS